MDGVHKKDLNAYVGCVPIAIGVLFGLFALNFFSASFSPEKLENVKVRVGQDWATTPAQKISAYRTIAGIMGGAAVFCLLFGSVWYAAHAKKDSRVPLGLLLLFMGVVFGGVAIHMGRQLATPGGVEAMRISEDGFPMTDTTEKAKVARLSLAAFGAGAVILFLSAWGCFRGPRKEDARALAEIPTIPISPSAVVAARRRNERRPRFMPPMYVGPQMALRSAIPWTAGTAVYLAMAASLPLWWPLPGIVYVFLAGLGLVGVWASVPLMRTWLAMQKLRIRILQAEKNGVPGGRVCVVARIEGKARVRVEIANLCLACVRKVGFGKREGFEYGHAVRVELARGLDLVPGGEHTVKGEVAIPEGATSSSGRVCWLVSVVAEVPGWPDLEVAQEVKVLGA